MAKMSRPVLMLASRAPSSMVIFSHRDRETAAIYLGHLLGVRREPATRLLRDLLGDPDDRIRDRSADTVTAAIHAGTLDAIGAARLYTP
ncbi:MAG: hypothetical protein ACRDRK_03300 [Pseudonocardia sp.]